MKKICISLTILLLSATAQATSSYLIKVAPEAKTQIMNDFRSDSSQTKDLNFENWIQVNFENSQNLIDLDQLNNMDGVIHAQINYTLGLLVDCPPGIPKPICDIIGGGGEGKDKPTPPGGTPTPPKEDPKKPAAGDNPDFPSEIIRPAGVDPLINKQWGMLDIGSPQYINAAKGKEIVLAVIDTGVDYTHEDLVENMWRNPGETGTDANGKDKTTNGIDDDGNGFIDDVMGWDFSAKDNKPYDLKGSSPFSGNPGHGTHVAGAAAAKGGNGIGVTGVAPHAKIMALRFLSEKGQGSTSDALLAIKYAVDNGALITNNSWGSVGEDPKDVEGNKALRDMIQYAQEKGVLFIAAAGNGIQGRGINNDTHTTPSYPASYKHENIISVAAVSKSDKLGSFSNWGPQTVDIAAPGVKIFSTVVGNGYTDTASALFGATWDGTSMAAPHVSGAAALYWAANPDKTWREVKTAILGSAVEVIHTKGKMTSNGKLNVKNLMENF